MHAECAKESRGHSPPPGEEVAAALSRTSSFSAMHSEPDELGSGKRRLHVSSVFDDRRGSLSIRENIATDPSVVRQHTPTFLLPPRHCDRTGKRVTLRCSNVGNLQLS